MPDYCPNVRQSFKQLYLTSARRLSPRGFLTFLIFDGPCATLVSRVKTGTARRLCVGGSGW